MKYFSRVPLWGTNSVAVFEDASLEDWAKTIARVIGERKKGAHRVLEGVAIQGDIVTAVFRVISTKQ